MAAVDWMSLTKENSPSVPRDLIVGEREASLIVLFLGVEAEMLMLSFRIDNIVLRSLRLETLSLVGKKQEDTLGVWDLSTPVAIVLDGKGNGQ